MLASFRWLQDYVDMPEGPDVILQRLTAAGVPSEGVRRVGDGVSKVVVGHLLEIQKHPNADRLTLTKVSTGAQTLNVVCGAKNIAPGQKVPLALIGATLPGGVILKPTQIRGVESEGMMCSARELGLGSDAGGIHILPPDAPLGADLLDYLGLPDTLFEPEITPNRSDLLSHFGLAREIAALLKKTAHFPEEPKVRESAATASRLASVTIQAGELCRLYCGRVLTGVKVGPSPAWLRDKLERVGARPINNVVDITNFILYESGQPLHAFDLAELKGGKIVVRTARDGERIPLLDGTVRDLRDPMLVIADAERPVALAGIMGGANSEVKETTTSILLESAWFFPASIRRTARALGISTDSSYRFERGVDPVMVRRALDRAAALIREIAGGGIRKGVLQAAAKSLKTKSVSFRPERSDAVLGNSIPAAKQTGILKRLGCRVKARKGSFQVTPPSWRVDLTREIDLIEEVARVSGYDLIDSVGPRVPVAPAVHDALHGAHWRSRAVFQQAGLNESVSYTFLPEDFADRLRLPGDHPFRKAAVLRNPTAADQKVLRPTLLPSLLSNAQVNFNRQQEAVHFFEIDKVFWPSAGAPEERLQAAALMSGFAPGASWSDPKRRTDFYDIKGLAEDIVSSFGLAGVKWGFGNVGAPYQASMSFQAQDPSGNLLVKGGAVDPRVLKAFDLSDIPCFALEADLPALAGTPGRGISFNPLPRFPSAWRDLALVVPDTVPHERVLEVLRVEGGAELGDLVLFDHYRGPHLPEGHRSLAYRLNFRHLDRTMTDEEVSGKITRILETLKTRFSIVPR